MKHFEVLLQAERGSGKLLLVWLDVLGQPGGGVDEQQLLAALQAGQEPLVVLGVLPHPRVAVVDVDGRYVLVGEPREDDEPFGKEVRLKAVAGAGVSQVHYYLIRFGIVGFEGEQHMVDKQVSIYLPGLKPEGGKRRQTEARRGRMGNSSCNCVHKLNRCEKGK